MCFCVFVFFLRKTQKHIDQFFLSFFFSNRIAAENQCVFCVYVFFLYRKHKNTKTKNWFVFLDTLATLRQKTKIVKQTDPKAENNKTQFLGSNILQKKPFSWCMCPP